MFGTGRDASKTTFPEAGGDIPDGRPQGKIKEIERKTNLPLVYLELVTAYTSFSATIRAAPATNATNAERIPGT